MTDVVWAQIPGWEGLYEASTDGEIRSMSRNVGYGRLGLTRAVKGRVLRQCVVGGYLCVSLSRPGARGGVHSRVHRLVLAAFSGEPADSRMHCCHNNGIRTDNRLCNLRWATAKENNDDKRAHGTWQEREKHPRAKLTSEIVALVRRGAIPTREAAEAAGASMAAIYDAKYGRTWGLVDGGSA